MTTGDRIKLQREALGMTQTELAQKTNSTKQTVYKYENNIVVNIPHHKIELLAEALGVTPGYLMGWNPENSQENGEPLEAGPAGPLEITDEREQEYLKKYRILDGYGRDAVWAVLDCEYQRCIKHPGSSDPVILLPVWQDEPKVIYLPEPVQHAAAGYGDPADDETSEPIAVRYNELTRKADYLMRVHGDSMEPKFHDGDRLLVRNQPSVEIGQIGIFLRDGERVVKIYRGDHLQSLNPDYPDLPFRGVSECKGLVIGVLDPDWIVT